MKRLLNKAFLFFAFLVFLIGTGEAINIPGMSKDKSLRNYLTRTQSSEVENSRDYNGTRAASINKKPWLAQNLQDMELLEWDDYGEHDLTDLPAYPYERDRGDIDPYTPSSWTIPSYGFQVQTVDPFDFRYYNSDCMFSAACPHVLGPVTSASNSGCYELYYRYPLFFLEGIIQSVKVKGPAKLSSTWPHITLYIYPNASYGSKVTVKVNTISDVASQEARLIEEVAKLAGNRVTEADLKVSRTEKGDTYYLNKGCSTTTLILCETVCECYGIAPTIYTDGGGTVASGGSINLWVDSGGFACPPYTWTVVSGTGYSLSKSETDNDLETNVLSLAGGT